MVGEPPWAITGKFGLSSHRPGDAATWYGAEAKTEPLIANVPPIRSVPFVSVRNGPAFDERPWIVSDDGASVTVGAALEPLLTVTVRRFVTGPVPANVA